MRGGKNRNPFSKNVVAGQKLPQVPALEPQRLADCR